MSTPPGREIQHEKPKDETRSAIFQKRPRSTMQRDATTQLRKSLSVPTHGTQNVTHMYAILPLLGYIKPRTSLSHLKHAEPKLSHTHESHKSY